jgi:DNA-binding MarR family transcriptional regulator
VAAPPPLGTQLRLLTARLDGDVQALYDELGAAFRPRFFPIVQHLLRSGAAPVSTLARATGVSQPAATQTIGEMARLGLVELSPGQDARERLVALSPAGLELVDRLQPLWDAIAEAARQLDRDLPHPLSKLLSSTLDALDREPFADRIRSNMQDV